VLDEIGFGYGDRFGYLTIRAGSRNLGRRWVGRGWGGDGLQEAS
jgi:hypothetical protein